MSSYGKKKKLSLVTGFDLSLSMQINFNLTGQKRSLHFYILVQKIEISSYVENGISLYHQSLSRFTTYNLLYS